MRFSVIFACFGLLSGCYCSHTPLPSEDGGTTGEADADAPDAGTDFDSGLVVTAGPFLRVSTAEHVSCALDADGYVSCWGVNLFSEENSDVRTPTRVPAVSAATDVEVGGGGNDGRGGGYACALVPSGVVCWGRVPISLDAEGRSPILEAVTLEGSDGALSLDATAGRICAAMRDGSVRCWGSMFDAAGCAPPGSLSAEPITLPGIEDAIDVKVDGGATCVMRAAQRPVCLVYADRSPDVARFEVFDAGVRDLLVRHTDACFVRMSHACAVSSAGNIECSPIGDDMFEPVIPADGARAIIELNSTFACYEDEARELRCTGVGAVASDLDDVSMSGTHACVISNGWLSCWGSNKRGALGTGVPARISAARAVFGIDGATSIAAGERHTCATLASGEVRCWGTGERAGLGWLLPDLVGLPYRRARALEISHAPRAVAGISPASAVFAGPSRTCAILRDGSVTCWGMPYTASLVLDGPTVIPGVSGAGSVSPGDDSQGCAIVDSEVLCWGRGYFGTRAGVVRVSLPAQAVEVHGDTYQTCARLRTGAVYCWGGRVDGSIGERTPIVPQPVPGVTDAIDVSGSCVVNGAHELSCWERATEGVDGVLLRGISGVEGSCAIRDDATVVCRQDFADPSPSDVWSWTHTPEVSNVEQLAVGRQHACALRTDGTVACWGLVTGGRIGDGSRTEFVDLQAVE